MAQMLPYTLQNGPIAEEVTYIYGACTHPAHRRQHLMDRLLHESFAIDRANGRAASILIPQEEWLFGFYAQFGYQMAFPVSSITVQEKVTAPALSVRSVQPADFSAMDCLYHRFLGPGPYLRRSERNGTNKYPFSKIPAGKFCVPMRRMLWSGMPLFGQPKKRCGRKSSFVRHRSYNLGLPPCNSAMNRPYAGQPACNSRICNR